MISGIQIPSHVAGETVDGETIVINLLTGAYHSLQGETARVWEALSSRELVHHDPSIEQIISNLRAAGIIELTEERSLTPPSDDPSAHGLTSYSDMAQLLLADPIHEVDDRGWPKLRADRP
jgi:hypothetical protein